MKVIIGGSMQFAEKMLEAQAELQRLGHEAHVSMNTESFRGKPDDEKEKIKLRQKFGENAIKHFWNKLEKCDALLILNFNKNGVDNYIGGNSLIDMAIAHYLNKKIFLLNPIPEVPYYKTEIQAMDPMFINGDLSKIK